MLPLLSAIPDATDEDVDRAIESGSVTHVFEQTILEKDRHVKAKDALVYVQTRYAEIKKLESSIVVSVFAPGEWRNLYLLDLLE